MTSTPCVRVLPFISPIFFVLCAPLRLEETLSEDDGVYSDMDPPNWQQLVKMEVLAELTPQEIKRQEVINGRAGVTHNRNLCVQEHVEDIRNYK